MFKQLAEPASGGSDPGIKTRRARDFTNLQLDRLRPTQPPGQ